MSAHFPTGMSHSIDKEDTADAIETETESNVSATGASGVCLCSICPDHPMFNGEAEFTEHYRHFHQPNEKDANEKTNVENPTTDKGEENIPF